MPFFVDTLGNLFALISYIQIVLDREHEIAKQQLAAGHKDRALIALRRRKYQEGLLVKTDGQLESLEQLVCTPALGLQPAYSSANCAGLHNRVLARGSLSVTWPQTG